MKALLIQPHSDDILFSCSHVLFGKGKHKFSSVEILTVENNKKRLAEDEKLKVHFPKLSTIHTLGMEFEDQSYYQYFKLHKEVDEAIVIDYLEDYFGADTLMKITNQLVNFVDEWFEENKGDCKIFCCLGIGHPFHRYVKIVLDDYIDYYYREFPHSYKKRNQPDFKALVHNLTLAYVVDDKDMHAKKFDVSKQVYKSQSSLLFFEQGYIKKQLPEEIYKNK
jgi:hypothetical protein